MVRRVHEMVGNAELDDDMYLIFGVGSTELIAASLWALSDETANEP